MSPSNTLRQHPLLAPLQARWSQLAVREKNLLKGATVLVLGAVLWQGLLSPALATLRSADAQTRVLDAQLASMHAMQTQAQALQKQAPLGFDEAVRALTSATQKTLGNTAQINIAGSSANISLQGAGADALAQWLTQARLNAHSVPVQARLTRINAASGAATWSGMLVMSLPAR